MHDIGFSMNGFFYELTCMFAGIMVGLILVIRDVLGDGCYFLLQFLFLLCILVLPQDTIVPILVPLVMMRVLVLALHETIRLGTETHRCTEVIHSQILLGLLSNLGKLALSANSLVLGLDGRILHITCLLALVLLLTFVRQ